MFKKKHSKMSDEQKKLLESQLWAIANILRGKISANQFQDYIQGFIFYKYIRNYKEFGINSFLVVFIAFFTRVSNISSNLRLLYLNTASATYFGKCFKLT